MELKDNLSIKALKLLEYCKQENRVCPQPDGWSKLWKLLPDKIQRGAAYIPAAPLILSGWWYSSDQDKSERLQEHISWADTHHAIDNVDDYLRALDESGWYHTEG